MIDNEITKTLECCLSINYEDCLECPLHNDFYPNLCYYEGNKNALDLINRQKTEIERLTKTAKSEAIKEFAERLKHEIVSAIDTYYNSNGGGYYLAENVVDDLLANGVVVLPCKCNECSHRCESTNECTLYGRICTENGYCDKASKALERCKQ